MAASFIHKKITIASRASKLAVVQAELVKSQLLAAFPDMLVDILTFTTSGDKHQEGLLSDIGNKGLFTKEIEEALLNNTADIAVHSAKDMATWLPQGLTIAGYLEREDVRDALICTQAANLQALPQGAVFGTSSLRRGAQVLRLRPDITIATLRGNVPTRLTKIEEGKFAATMLAMAGLNRLGIAAAHIHPLPVEEILPAVAQGAIALQCRSNDEAAHNAIAAISYATTGTALLCERAFLAALDGSCRTPLGAYARIENGVLKLDAMIIKPDGSQVFSTSRTGVASDAEAMGRDAGEELKHKGGAGFFSI